MTIFPLDIISVIKDFATSYNLKEKKTHSKIERGLVKESQTMKRNFSSVFQNK